MIIRISNLPVEKKIPCIKALRFSFVSYLGEGLMGLKEAKELFESYVATTSNPFITISGTMNPDRTLHQVRRYINSNYSCRMVTGKDSCDTFPCCDLPNVQVDDTANDAKIKSSGTQVFSVPNNEEGKTFLDLASKFCNRPTFSIRKRGRGSRQEHGDRSDIPLDNAEWIALYVNGNPVEQIHNIATLQNEVARLNDVIKKQDRTEAELELRLDIICSKSKKQIEHQVKSIDLLEGRLRKTHDNLGEMIIEIMQPCKLKIIGAKRVAVVE